MKTLFDFKNFVLNVLCLIGLVSITSCSGHPYDSLEDFEDKLEGKTYACCPEGSSWFKFEIDGDKVTMYHAMPSSGEWSSPIKVSATYKQEWTGDTGDKIYSLNFSFFSLWFPAKSTRLYEEIKDDVDKGCLYMSGNGGTHLASEVDPSFNPWED